MQRFDAALHAWPGAERVGGPLSGGNRNAVWQVRIGGERYAARQSRRSSASIAWEIALLDELHAAGMWVPRALPAPDGRCQVDGVVLFTWLDGDSPANERDWRAVASELERLHGLTRGWAQRPGAFGILDLLTHDQCGDVQLDLLPGDAMHRCRAAWCPLAAEPVAVIHGDPSAANIRIANGRVGFIDWDEARVDVPLLDLADLPLTPRAIPDQGRLDRARRAASAWEAVTGWTLEPDYARRRLARVPPVT